MKRIFIFCVFAIFVSAASFAEEPKMFGPCKATETPSECQLRLNPGSAKELSSKEIEAVRTAIQQKTASEPTGLPSLNLPTGSAKRDFLSLFAASVSNAKVNDAGTTYTMDWNVPVGIFGPKDILKLQAVVNTAPTIDASLKTALESHAGASVDTGDKNDITVSTSYAPVGIGIGRSIAPHKAFLETLAVAAYDAARPSNEAERARDLKLQQLIKDGLATPGPDFSEPTFGGITDPLQAIELAKLTAEAASVAKDSQQKVVLSNEQFGVNRVYALLGNQPQFYVSALYHERSPEIGADEFSGRLTYEWSSINLNSFYRAAGDACSKRSDPECIKKFGSYVKDNADAIDNAPRFSLSIDVAQTHANDIVVPKFAINLHSSSARKVLASAAYSREFHQGTGERDSRFDASVSYEDVTGDATKDDRFIGSAIFTQKINDTFSLPVGIVFANHKQYLPKSDRELGVHIGLVYKLKPLTGK